MADTVETAPDDYETSTSFMGDLIVTSDFGTVASAKGEIGLFGSAPLTANAGTDKTIVQGGTLYLDASSSNYSNGAIVNYTWEIGTNVFGTSNAQDSFVPVNLSVGTHTLILTVRDEEGATARDTVNVIVTDGEDDLPSIGGKK